MSINLINADTFRRKFTIFILRVAFIILLYFSIISFISLGAEICIYESLQHSTRPFITFFLFKKK